LWLTELGVMVLSIASYPRRSRRRGECACLRRTPVGEFLTGLVHFQQDRRVVPRWIANHCPSFLNTRGSLFTCTFIRSGSLLTVPVSVPASISNGPRSTHRQPRWQHPPGTIEDSEGSRFYVRFRKPLLYPTELRGLQSLYTCVGEHTVNYKYHRPVPLIQIISDVVLNNSRYLTELHLSCPQT
jgi:hypothetical protein